jgi:hypothetical protein
MKTKTYKNEIGEISKEQYDVEQALYALYKKDKDYSKYIRSLRVVRGEA